VVVSPILMPSPVPELPQSSMAQVSMRVLVAEEIFIPLPMTSAIQQSLIRALSPVTTIPSLVPVVAVSIYKPLTSTLSALMVMVSALVTLGINWKLKPGPLTFRLCLVILKTSVTVLMPAASFARQKIMSLFPAVAKVCAWAKVKTAVRGVVPLLLLLPPVGSQ